MQLLFSSHLSSDINDNQLALSHLYLYNELLEGSIPTLLNECD